MRLISSQLIIVALLALSLTVSGFAHKAGQAPIDADLQTYLEMGGTLEGICGSLGKAGAATPDCEACRLADTMMTPIKVSQPMQIILPVTFQMRHVALLRHHAKPLDPTRLSRAPPQA